MHTVHYYTRVISGLILRLLECRHSLPFIIATFLAIIYYTFMFSQTSLTNKSAATNMPHSITDKTSKNDQDFSYSELELDT